jgi:uncharacterized membrane protein YfcA
MEPISILIIIVVFFVASFFSSVVGGAGLITIPTLMFLGLSPHMALGTSRIGAFGNTSGSAVGYAMQGKIDYKTGLIFMIFSVTGAIIGTFTVLSLPEQFIKRFIGLIIILIVIFIFLNPGLGIKNKKKKRNITLLTLYALVSGFFVGFFGAGIGIVNRLVLSAFFSYAIINSSAISSFANSITTLFSFAIFALFGKVMFSLFIPIILASFIGAYLGSRYAVKIGNVNVKRILLTAAVIMAAKLLFF